MSFKNLDKRYQEKAKDLYRITPDTWDTGKPYYYNELKVGSMSSAIKNDSRALPITSTVRDVKRLTAFSTSGKGIKFLLKQQLLQTGNTFGAQQTINPAFVLANAVPFIHLRRSLIGKLGSNLDGRLQKSTGTTVSSKVMMRLPSVFGGPASTSFSSSIKDQISNIAGNLLDYAKNATINPILNTISPKNTVYGIDTRPELEDSTYMYKKYITLFNSSTSSTTSGFKQNYDGLDTNFFVSSFDFPSKRAPADRFEIINTDRDSKLAFKVPTQKDSQIKEIYNKISSGLQPSNVNLSYALNGSAAEDQKSNVLKNISLVTISTIQDVKDYKGFVDTLTRTNGKVNYINDPDANPYEENNYLLANNKVNYTHLSAADFEDYINVKIEIPNKESVKFRAFVTDIRSTVTPQYTSKNYIGRIGRFTTYSGVSRKLQFVLKLVPFSKNELDAVYARLNFLTGTTMPLGFSGTETGNQYLNPPIVKFTLGNLFNRQPGYFENLTMNFSETFDIDKQVPNHISVTATFIILEKRENVYDNSLYGLFDETFSTSFGPLVQGPPSPIAPDAGDAAFQAVIQAVQDEIVSQANAELPNLSNGG